MAPPAKVTKLIYLGKIMEPDKTLDAVAFDQSKFLVCMAGPCARLPPPTPHAGHCPLLQSARFDTARWVPHAEQVLGWQDDY